MAYDGSIKFDTSLDTKKFNDGINKLKSTATAGFAAVGAAAAAGIGGAIKVGMDFEAQMSRVGAISMASAEDMEILRAKAKEMGETTVFSASQAGEAFEYMAMAGWKTEEMTSGIAGIMDLAAASGENLGTVSDIVTDALTAFGLSAQDSGHFANVLAAASSNSNTNVAMMGETFKYVAPLAGSLGYSVEDTAVAIGLMANSGIKAGQAGTSLRSILTRLTKPPKEAATAMKTLGISMQDASGQMKPFNVLMKDMRTAFAKLDKSQRPAFAEMLGGQEAMSGLLAIVNASDKDFDKLTGAIEGAGGAAKEMADRNLDNLKGQLTLAGSAAEGLGIAVYEGIQEPLKNAVKVGAAKISELTASLKGGELQPALQSVGNLLGNVANAVVGLATNAIPPLVSVLGFLGNNLTTIIPIATAFFVVVKGWAIFAEISKAIAAATTVISGLTTAIGVQTAAAVLATKAQLALSAAWAANPVGIVVAGVISLTAGLYALYQVTQKQDEATIKAIETANNRKKLIDDEKKSYDELRKSQTQKAESDLAQVAYTETLLNELGKLADAEGHVNEKNQARAAFILGELNTAYGTEYSLIDGQILKYKDLQTEIDNLIEKKKFEILQEAALPFYQQAVTDEIKNRMAAASDLMALDEQRDKVNALIAENEKKYAEDTSRMRDINKSKRESDMQDDIDLLHTLESNYAKSTDKIKNSIEDRTTFEEAAAYAQEGLYEKAASTLSSFSSGYADAMRSCEGDLEKQKQTTAEYYAQSIIALEDYARKYKDGVKGYTEEGLQTMISNANNMREECDKIGVDVGDGIIEGLEGKTKDLTTSITEISKLLPDTMRDLLDTHSPSKVMDEIGCDVMLGLSEGITRTGASVMVEAGNVGLNIARGIAAGISLGAPTINQAAASAVSGAIQAAKDAGVIRSPSRKMKKEVGLQLSIGAAKGILQGIPNIKTAMSKTISTGISYAEKAAGMAKHVGEIIPAKMAAGMAENEKTATEQLDKMLAVLDHQRAMDLINDAEYYEGLTKLRDDYLAEGTKEYAQQTEKIYSYYKDLAEDQEKLMQEQKEAVKDLFSDLADYASDRLDDVQGEIDSFAEKLRGIGGLYDEIDLGGGRKYKRLRNFEEDSAAMESYGEQLTALREKLSRTNMDAGTIKMFFAELRDLDIAEGLDLTRMFNQMSEADFTAYLAGYKKKYDVSQQVAGMLHGDEYADAVQDINEHTSGEIIKFMKEELEAAGAEIPDGFFDVGRQSAENFSGSFLTVFQNMLNEVKSQIDAASASFAPHLAYAVGTPGNYASTVYGDTNYNIYGGNSDDLTAQIQAMETRKRMLGIGG